MRACIKGGVLRDDEKNDRLVASRISCRPVDGIFPIFAAFPLQLIII
jgi:hypothetical protein